MRVCTFLDFAREMILMPVMRMPSGRQQELARLRP
jgi:hypothetical protein